MIADKPPFCSHGINIFLSFSAKMKARMSTENPVFMWVFSISDIFTQVHKRSIKDLFLCQKCTIPGRKISPRNFYNEVPFGSKPFITFVLLIFGCEKSMITMIRKVLNGANREHAG